ncbi:hypothetical protein GCM10009834_34310 [Streptomonospora arabica]|uniref:Uncharacterized protein n=1 Tax=Streptomonospora halophila TaxID=427369 RepID=A0ABP9GI59_9ACTN
MAKAIEDPGSTDSGWAPTKTFWATDVAAHTVPAIMTTPSPAATGTIHMRFDRRGAPGAGV